MIGVGGEEEFHLLLYLGYSN